MKKLLVLDANSLLNRAFYGVRPLTAKSGLHTNAVFGYVNILSKHLDAISPDCVAAAFDLKAPTFRHKMYAEYKAGRHAMPEELVEQVPYIKAVTEALGIKLLSLEGYEADDILGTLSRKYGEETHTYIVTGDRDSLQLVSKNTTVILATTGKDEEYTPERVMERYLVTPERLVDIKALMGDSSDNIPGVAGIGEKGAIKLISENGDLDTLYSSLDSGSIKLTPSLEKKLSEGRESAYFSRTLAKICTEAPLELDLSDLVRAPIDKPRLTSLFRELEFTKMSEKFGLTDIPTEENSLQLTFDTADVDTPSAELVTDDIFVLGDGVVFIDLDTSSHTLYRYTDGKTIKAPVTSDLIKKLGEKRLCLWDSKSFWQEAINLNADIPEACVTFDVMIASYVENPDTKGDFSHTLMRNLSRSVPSVFADSAEHRVQHLEDLYTSLSQAIKERGAEELYYEIELPLTRVLARMESVGFTLDCDSLSDYGKTILDKMNSIEQEIYLLCGEAFNLNSPKQLGHILYEKMGLPVLKKKKTGYSTDAETLEKLRFHSPVIDYILDYRKLSKLYGTYVEGLLKVAGDDGRIHTDFKQTGTVTGRLSSAEPNLQNIPIRTEEGSLLRRFFIPSANQVLIDADYSQIELRILAHMANDEAMISAFNSGMDIHTVTASQVFKTPIEQVTPSLRSRAKAVNFGIVYGIGDFSLSQDLHVSVKEAKSYIDGYFNTYKKVKEYLDKTVEFAIQNGYVETLYKRRRYIPELSSSNKNLQGFGKRVAMNTPIQGTAADIIKRAMVAVDRRLEAEQMETRLILQVHDELILSAPENECEKASAILKEEMENATRLSILLQTDVGVGKNWLDAKK
jgi:DNA polymerase-1